MMNKLFILVAASFILSMNAQAQAQTTKKVAHKTYSSKITPQVLAQITYDKYDKHMEFTQEQKTVIMPILEKYSAEKINAKANNDPRTIQQIEEAEYNAITVHCTEEQLYFYGASQVATQVKNVAKAANLESERKKLESR